MLREEVKQSDITPQGLIKIELFDSKTGERCKEVNTHNFIAKGVLDMMFKAKVSDIFTKGRLTGGHEISKVFNDPFAWMVLTDADHPEDPENEWLRAGKLIGYATTDSAYSGSSATQGSYNASESFTKHGHVKIVIDFPTNTANGTFQSIYFTPKTTMATDSLIIKDALSGHLRSQKYKDHIYLLKATAFEKYDLEWNLIESTTLTKDSYRRSFIIVDDVIYYASSSSGISTAPLTDPATMTKLKSVSGVSMTGIDYIPEKDQFITTDSYSSSLTKIHYWDREFNEVGEAIPIPGAPTGWSSVALTYVDENFIFIGNKCIDTKHDYTAYTVTLFETYGIFDNYVTSSSYLHPKAYIGSRARLPEPVTKEEGQVMKVTYEFILPKAY